MINLFRSLNFERLSFWIGFAAATVFWWLFLALRPYLKRSFITIKDSLRSTKQGLQSNIAARHRAATIEHAQGNHLACALFALDEILIPPRLLTQPVFTEPGKEPPYEDIITRTIPYMPDRPELASAYGAHTISLADAIQGGSHIALVGPPGSGKSVALAHFACELARQENEQLKDFVPVLIHAADLNLLEISDETLDAVIQAVSHQGSALSAARLPNFLRTTFETGQAALLLDGLDEMDANSIADVVDYLRSLLSDYPLVKVVTAANPKHYGGLTDLGFVPLPMAIWGPRQQAQFVQQWGGLWFRYIDDDTPEDDRFVHPLLLNGWLLNRASAVSPFEFTLHVWAVYAGDVRGPNLSDALEAYIRRMTVGISKTEAALERLSTQAVFARRLSFTKSQANQWIAEIEPEGIGDKFAQSEDGEFSGEITVQRILPELEECGLLVKRTHERLGFVHSLIPGHMAGLALSTALNENLYSQPPWLLRDLTIQFIASQRDLSEQASQLLAQTDDPLYRGAIFVSEWLPHIPLASAWRKLILSKLSTLLNDEALPLGARARLLTSLANTRDTDISALFRHLLKSSSVHVRQLAALGSGYHRDTQAVEQLVQQLDDQPSASRAACLALVNIGTQPALEAIASALLQGNEDLRHAAAEAFANHPEEGYPTLREATSIDDLLVRRAAISGLRRIHEDWAIQILEELQIEDAQWVVKNAAAQAIEDYNRPDMYIPQTQIPLADLPWLISFAAERGVGVSPGEPARQMLKQALELGTEEQQMAALFEIQRRDIAEIFPGIFNQYFGSDIELREIAYNTIWLLAANGNEIPSPTQFGMGKSQK